MNANAWGKRGHSIVCQTAAALLAASEPKAEFLKKHSFDLGYYCNVPDLVWKRPATYDLEFPQHFMDLEIFERAFKKSPRATDPFLLSRAEFEQAYPDVPLSAGRSYWRIQELTADLKRTADSLSTKPNADLQEKCLVLAGAIGHYVGDLSQPLHVTENYDGAMTKQKGIHAFFEDTLVDELSSTEHPSGLEATVGDDAQKGWPAFHKQSSARTILQLIEDLAKTSNETIPKILSLDKETRRTDVKKASRVFEPILRARLAAGSLALAELWSRELGWTYHGEKFYNFSSAPAHIALPMPPRHVK